MTLCVGPRVVIHKASRADIDHRPVNGRVSMILSQDYNTVPTRNRRFILPAQHTIATAEKLQQSALKTDRFCRNIALMLAIYSIPTFYTHKRNTTLHLYITKKKS